MTALILVHASVHDPDAYMAYMAATPATIAAHGGAFVFRNGPREALEGEDGDHRIVVIAFPDAGTARTWYNSDGYAAAKALRKGIADLTMTLLEDVDANGLN